MASKKSLVDLEILGDVSADSFIKDGGVNTEFLKADGSIDDNVYITREQPDAPASATASIVGETIELTFTEAPPSTTPDVDRYEIFSSVAGDDYSLLTVVEPDSFLSSMVIVDNTFDSSGTISYKVYTIRNGVYSDEATASVSFTAPTLNVSNLSAIPTPNTFVIQYDLPNSRFIDNVEIDVRSAETSGGVSLVTATQIYTGNREDYTYIIPSAKLNHYFVFDVTINTL